MNEKIKERLMSVGIDLHYDNDSGYVLENFTLRDAEKFAELIVRDCLQIVNRKEYSYHEADPLWETAQLIKQHFGVDQ